MGDGVVVHLLKKERYNSLGKEQKHLDVTF